MGQIYRIQTNADGNIISSPDCRGYPFSWAFQEKDRNRKPDELKKTPNKCWAYIFM
jgi:hypothetical protein